MEGKTEVVHSRSQIARSSQGLHSEDTTKEQLFKQARPHGFGGLPGMVRHDCMTKLPSLAPRLRWEDALPQLVAGGSKGLLVLSHADP